MLKHKGDYIEQVSKLLTLGVTHFHFMSEHYMPLSMDWLNFLMNHKVISNIQELDEILIMMNYAFKIKSIVTQVLNK